MDQTIEELVSQVERSRNQRKPRTQWALILIGIMAMVLIWTTEVPLWLTDVSSYVLLVLVFTFAAFYVIQGDAQKNEELLLSLLKKQLNQGANVKI
jgi:hypothetical protein